MVDFRKDDHALPGNMWHQLRAQPFAYRPETHHGIAGRQTDQRSCGGVHLIEPGAQLGVLVALKREFRPDDIGELNHHLPPFEPAFTSGDVMAASRSPTIRSTPACRSSRQSS